MTRCSYLPLSVVVAVVGACAPPEAEGPPACVDSDPPVAHHTPIEGPVRVGQRVLVEAAFEDGCGVFSAELHYRREASVMWTVVGMIRVGETPQGALFQGSIRGEDVDGAGMFYYLTALDGSPDLNEVCAPEGCYDAPYRFGVVAE